MSVTLALTDRARTELADGTARGLRAVAFTRLAIGAGVTPAGTDDTARSALRVQKDAVAVTGDSAVAGRIALRGDFTAVAETFAVTEVGIFARTGGAGAEWLFGYWCGAAAGDAIARADPAATLVVAGVVEVAASAAELTVLIAATIQVGAPGAATTASRGVVELATGAEVRLGADDERAVTPAALAQFLPQTGDVKFSALANAPAGWLVCDGSILAADSPHAALRTALGSRFALGTDPGGTVRLPDARRAALIGSGGLASAVVGATVGSRGGEETHTLTVAEMPPHTHTYRYIETPNEDGHGGTRHADYPRITDGRATGSAGGGGAHNNMPPSLVVLVLIKT